MENPEKEKIIEAEASREKGDFFNTVKTQLLDNYPFDEGEEEKIREKLEILFSKIKELDNESLVSELRKIVLSLDNSHTLLVEKEAGSRLVADHEIKRVEDKYWIEKENNWYEVISIDEQPINELIEESIKEIPGGNKDYKKEAALAKLLSTSTKKETQLIIDENNNQKDLTINFNEAKESSLEQVISSRIIDNIGYISINSWMQEIDIDGDKIPFIDVLDKELEKISQSDSIIIDVRENGGGRSEVTDQFAGRFIAKQSEYSVCKERDKSSGELVVTDTKTIKPRGDHLSQRLVILTSPKCLSSNEMFIASLKDIDRAETIGENTGGGSGRPERTELEFGGKKFDLLVSTWRQYRMNGQEIEGQGIEPDIEVHQTLEDLNTGRDTVLEKALEYFSKN